MISLEVLVCFTSANIPFRYYENVPNTDTKIIVPWDACGIPTVKIRFGCMAKLQSQPIGLPKIFIDYFFFQVGQWDCTKFLSICDRFVCFGERFRTFQNVSVVSAVHHFSKGKCFESSSYDFSHLSS